MPNPNLKVYECVTGSQLYGTAMPDSDTDYVTVFSETKNMTLGLDGLSKLAQSSKDEDDIRQYWLRRWVTLCAKGNPNVLESLFVPPHLRKMAEPLFVEQFLNHPELFLFKKPLVDAHLGFAFAQIKRMDGTNLGSKRKELVAEYGYDVKYAAHAYRLVAQLESILTTGKIVLPYPEPIRQKILSIRHGKVSRPEFDKMYIDLAESVKATADRSNDLPDDIEYTNLNNAVVFYFEQKYYWLEVVEGCQSCKDFPCECDWS